MPRALKKIRHFFHRFFFTNYSILLVFLAFLFIFRPYGDRFSHLAVWQAILTGAFLCTLLNANHHRYVRILASILAVPTVALCWIYLFFPLKSIFISNVILITVFLLLVTASVVYHVVLRARVT